jgi:hypothetical protein
MARGLLQAINKILYHILVFDLRRYISDRFIAMSINYTIIIYIIISLQRLQYFSHLTKPEECELVEMSTEMSC